jgi:1-acyl-sn-glycerol-3-phosphate acyltransferase
VLYRVMKSLTHAVLRLLFRMRVIGAENIPPEGPALLAANHVSVLDPPVVGSGASRPLQFMAKAELFRIPLLGRLIRGLNAYPVEREGADAGALRHALLLLREGKALLVFPEGTRGTEGALQRGRPGAGMLAALSEAPVVPVYVEGTGRVLPRGATRMRRWPITVRYGPPLRFERGRGKHRYQEISDQIMAAIDRLKAEAEQASPTARLEPASSKSVGARGPGHEEGDRGLEPRLGTNAERTVRGSRPAGQIH